MGACEPGVCALMCRVESVGSVGREGVSVHVRVHVSVAFNSLVRDGLSGEGTFHISMSNNTHLPT